MLPLLAVPVLHSSGAFIAYSGTGYLAGTLSSSWLGAFVLGNSGLLAGVVVKLNWPQFYSLASTFSLTRLVSNRHYVDVV